LLLPLGGQGGLGEGRQGSEQQKSEQHG
jgi:hypothetical protein